MTIEGTAGEEGPEQDTSSPSAARSTSPSPPPRVVVRIVTPGDPKFQLRKGEAGISVFDPQAVSPQLTEAEVVSGFRPGSVAVTRSVDDIEAKGLQVVAVLGASTLPPRLQQAHAEIVPGPGMTRAQFKNALKGLE
jgi:hypothetical protein